VKGDTLGERGHAYAGDVAQYVYSKAGKAYPVVDHNATDTRVQLDGVQDLPKAIGQGLKISSQKLSPVVSQDRTCPERMRLPERRDGYDVLEVVPRRRKERAKSGNWRWDTVYITGRASLYEKDEKERRWAQTSQDVSSLGIFISWFIGFLNLSTQLQVLVVASIQPSTWRAISLSRCMTTRTYSERYGH
jgi:hypothetical protein